MSNLKQKPKQKAAASKSEVLPTRKRGRPKLNGTAAEKKDATSKAKKLKLEPELVEEEQVECGSVLTVGAGEVGQLGLGEDVESRTRPSAINFDKPVKAVCAGGMHTVLLTENGQVYTFGCNDEGAIGRDSSESSSEFLPELVEIPSKVKQVSAGDSHTAALTYDGRVYIWGNFRDSDGPMGLLESGRKELRPFLIPMEEKVAQIASGSDHLAMLTTSGQLYTCGNAEQGQLGRVAECFSAKGGRKGLDYLLTPQVIRMPRKALFDGVWAGSWATFARAKKDQKIYACGLNNYNQLGAENKERIYSLSAIPSLSNNSWKQFACGNHHTLGLTREGQVYAMGRHDYGRLGLGPQAQDAASPTPVTELSTEPCLVVSCGVASSYAVGCSGKSFAWGLGNSGQLGQGNEDETDVPVAMSGRQLEDRKVLSVSAGGQHAVLLVRAEETMEDGHSSTPASHTTTTTAAATPSASDPVPEVPAPTPAPAAEGETTTNANVSEANNNNNEQPPL